MRSSIRSGIPLNEAVQWIFKLCGGGEFVIGALDLETDTFRDNVPVPETTFVRWILWRVHGVDLLGNGVRSGRVVD